ncbi:MAG: hypothetical protein ABI867_22410 [Kofleriaceae bacterium]
MLFLALATTGCGLIDSDITNFDLTLPDKKFTVDTASFDITDAEAQPLLETSCSSNPSVCNSAAQAACPMNCAGECSTTTQTCNLALEVSVYQGVDLIAERPELKSIDDEPVIEVSIDSVTYEVTTNTLNIETPPLTVYVAPTTVMDPNDPAAKPIGTIEGVAAGARTDAPQPIAFTATGKADLVAAMSTFKTPFNVIVGATLIVSQGQSVPTGKMDAVVHITGHAGL